MTDTINSISKIFSKRLTKRNFNLELNFRTIYLSFFEADNKKKKSTVFGHITIFNLYKTFAMFTLIITILLC